jgi:hypothetical protein
VILGLTQLPEGAIRLTAAELAAALCNTKPIPSVLPLLSQREQECSENGRHYARKKQDRVRMRVKEETYGDFEVAKPAPLSVARVRHRRIVICRWSNDLR